MHIGSYWADFKFGVKNDFIRDGNLLLAGKESGTLHFLCIFAHTGMIINWGYKMVFFVMVLLC